MIRHLAPRRVALVSATGGTQCSLELELSNIVEVALLDDPSGGFNVVVDFSSGKQIVAGRYDDASAAGRDFGKLRVLAGLPAWPEEWQRRPFKAGFAPTTAPTTAGHWWNSASPC
jgi:hypothetical protein